jgi:hypothetical protein
MKAVREVKSVVTYTLNLTQEELNNLYEITGAVTWGDINDTLSEGAPFEKTDRMHTTLVDLACALYPYTNVSPALSVPVEVHSTKEDPIDDLIPF